jgi:hypothetical protein
MVIFTPTDASIATEAAHLSLVRRSMDEVQYAPNAQSFNRCVRRFNNTTSVASFSSARTKVSHQTLMSASIAP